MDIEKIVAALFELPRCAVPGLNHYVGEVAAILERDWRDPDLVKLAITAWVTGNTAATKAALPYDRVVPDSQWIADFLEKERVLQEQHDRTIEKCTQALTELALSA